MKNLALIALIAGASAGVGSAALTVIALQDGGSPVAGLDPAGPGDLEGLEELRRENADLAERVRQLESRLALERTDRAPVAAPSSGMDLDELRKLLASLNDVGSPPPAGLQSMVERALEVRDEQEQREREERRRVAAEERLDRRVADLAEKLGLDPTQQQGMRQVLSERDLVRDQFMEQMRGGGFAGADRETIRDQAQTLYEESNTQIQSLLSPAQWEQYQELDDRGGNFMRGRNFGGGGRGGR